MRPLHCRRASIDIEILPFFEPTKKGAKLIPAYYLSNCYLIILLITIMSSDEKNLQRRLTIWSFE